VKPESRHPLGVNYKQYFERDTALQRCFQFVKVDEPDDASACLILRGRAGRQLPDKVFDLLETVSARVRMSLQLAAAGFGLFEQSILQLIAAEKVRKPDH
jgi:type VI secretion system protein VasG